MGAFFFSVLLTILVGASAGIFLRRIGLAGAIAASLLAGSLLLTWEMLLFARIGISWNVALLVTPWIAVAAAAWWKAGRPIPSRADFAITPWAALPIGVGLAVAGVWLPYERAMPLTTRNWDAWAIWLLKARAFWLDGGIGPFLERSGELTTQAGYPLLVPLQGTFTYLVAGAAEGQVAKLWTPVGFFAGSVLFAALARQLAPAWLTYSATAVLVAMNMQHVMAFEYAGYADSLLGFYFAACGGLLILWIRHGERLWLVGAIVAATAAAWTKNEGQFFLAAIGGIVVLQLLRSRSGWLDWALSATIPVAVIGPWLLTLNTYGVGAAGFTPGVDFVSAFFLRAVGSVAQKAFAWEHFQLAFPLFVAACALAMLRRASLPHWVIPGLVAWHLTGALLAYATGRNDIDWWLETSALRLLGQITPLMVLGMVAIAADWVGPEPVGESAAQAPERDRTKKTERPTVKRRKRQRKP